MAPLTPSPVAVIGLGVIGGSIALALRDRGVDVRGHAASADDRQAAAAAGIPVAGDDAADHRLTMASLLDGVAAAVIAVPVEWTADVARRALPCLPERALLLHAASLQRRDALGLEDDRVWQRLLGAHPLAGSERSGFDAARRDLFAGSTVSVEARATPEQRATVERLWQGAGAGRVEYRTAEEHDRRMAWISHLPQLAATALAAALAGEGIAPPDAGPGARDTTRLAGSSLAMWRGILGAAPRDTTRALAALERELARLRGALERGDHDALARVWEAGRAWRRAVSQQREGRRER